MKNKSKIMCSVMNSLLSRVFQCTHPIRTSRTHRTFRTILTLSLFVFTVLPSRAQSGNCEPALAEAYLDVNNVRARVLNNGGLFWRSSPHVYEVPKYSGKNAIFAAGIWFGGQVNGELLTAATTYGPWEFWPGPLDEAGNPPADCQPFDRIYNIYARDVLTYEATGEISNDLRDWPWELGAPVIDGDGDPDNYNLAGGDRPEIRGHQTLWWVMNDRGNVHERTDTEPIGLEVQVTAFAAASEDEHINNATLYQYKFIYKGEAPLEDTYFGFFQDVDLGNFADDLVGVDTTLGLGYTYNADNLDEGGEGYGEAPPAVGFDIVAGPLAPTDSLDNDQDGMIDEDGERRGITTFFFYNGGGGVTGDPSTASDFYNYMLGRWKDGQRFTFGGNGRDFSTIPTSFMFPGDPVTGEGWSEVNPAADGSLPPIQPADRRSGLASGPFTMQPGEEQVITLAIVWARGADNLDSITQLREASRTVQEAVDAGFDIASPNAGLLPQVIQISPADNAMSQPIDPTFQWEALDLPTLFEIQVAPEESFSDPLREEVINVTSLRIPDLLPFTGYYWRIRALDAGNKGPWSQTWQFATSDISIGDDFFRLDGFMTTQNAAGPIDPPDMAAFAFDSTGFPMLEGTLTPAGSYPDPERPTSGVQQSTNTSVWGIHTGGENRRLFANDDGQSFLERSIINRGNNLRIGDSDYEWRFTRACSDAIDGAVSEGDCLAWRAFSDGAMVEVPFALWSIGNPADSTDDHRMIPVICEEACGAGTTPNQFDIGQDHAISEGNDDPYTDWTYWFRPEGAGPFTGETGYVNFFFEEGKMGDEVLARTVLVQLDGGTTAPYDVALPEPGTTFRFVTGKTIPPILASPLNNEIRNSTSTTMSWHGPENAQYHLQIDTAPDFENPDLDIPNLAQPLYLAGDFPKNATYYWRVRTLTPAGVSVGDWSETWQFTIPLNVGTDEQVLVNAFSLAQSYPNPFQTSATITYTLPEAVPVKLEVFDLLGRRIRVLVDATQPAGRHEAVFDGAGLSIGVYLYRITAGEFRDVKTMTLIR